MGIRDRNGAEGKTGKISRGNRRPLGRRPVQIDFVADACYVVGAEINKYQIAVCLMDLRGNVIESSRYVPDSDEYDLIIQALSLIHIFISGSCVRSRKAVWI